ncbi:MAG: hypothetical protein KME17_14765 [Cyanosarcina radialis HA8281-LM2]|nr:hypothetical protein [Cyanosarcina radialis HA8281-LM2]
MKTPGGWHDFFPEDCPPNTAQPASGTVYLFVKDDPPTPEDFRSKRQKNPNLKFPNDEKECQACGISVFTQIDDLLSLQRRFPAF